MRRHGFRWVLSFGLIFSVGFGVGCSEDAASPTPGSSDSGAVVSKPSTPSRAPTAPSPTAIPVVEEPVVLSAEALIEAGRSVYNANCIACHSMDPTEDGALGPAVAGSTLELLETRVLRGEYPEGYEPKRPTRVMIPLPHLEPRLAELAAYLDSLE